MIRLKSLLSFGNSIDPTCKSLTSSRGGLPKRKAQN